MVKDPVCGMQIDPKSAVDSRQVDGKTYYFCSDACVQKFDAKPEQYLVPEHPQDSRTDLVGSATTGFNPKLTGPQKIEIPILNLDCATCVRTIEKSLSELEGVKNASVNFATTKAHVTYDPSLISLPVMETTIKKAGYAIGGAETQIGIKDLHCASCVTLIEDTLKQTPGVLKATVNVTEQKAAIQYVPGMVSLHTLRQVVEFDRLRDV